jgi:hypothetical protein
MNKIQITNKNGNVIMQIHVFFGNLQILFFISSHTLKTPSELFTIYNPIFHKVIEPGLTTRNTIEATFNS